MSDGRRLFVDYPAADQDRAEKALEDILDDLKLPAGPVAISQDHLLGEFRSRGITRGLAKALLDHRTEVFQYRELITPAGSTPAGVIGGVVLHAVRLEPEVDEVYVTTRDLWYDYLARREQERQRQTAPALPIAETETAATSWPQTQASPPAPAVADPQQKSAAAVGPLDLFPDFSKKQELLLLALWGKGKVRIEAVLRAVYKNKRPRVSEDALDHLKKRTNRRLAEKRPQFEIKRKGNTLELSPV
jgi:hypothetical protein